MIYNSIKLWNNNYVQASKANLRINTKKLYCADRAAVQELLKITNVLYDAQSMLSVSLLLLNMPDYRFIVEGSRICGICCLFDSGHERQNGQSKDWTPTIFRDFKVRRRTVWSTRQGDGTEGTMSILTFMLFKVIITGHSHRCGFKTVGNGWNRNQHKEANPADQWKH